MTVNDLWWRGDEKAWLARRDVYWSLIKPHLRAIEKEMESLDRRLIQAMDAEQWYAFLLKKYFPWKYTAPNRLASTTKYLRSSVASGGLEKLHRIKNEIFGFDTCDANRGLEIATQIPGLGVAGASGLLSLLFPETFGTVDQFVVKALWKVHGLPEAGEIARMKPEGLSIKDGVILIAIMRGKAEALNQQHGSSGWTPRRVDMVLWTYGRGSAGDGI